MSTTTNAKTQKIADETTKQFEENAERMREFNANVLATSKSGARVVVDNYEKAAKSMFDLQRQIADSNRVEWVKDVANTQIQFVEDVTAAWTKASRDLLK